MYDLTVFDKPEQQAIIADILEDLSKIREEIEEKYYFIRLLESDVKWLKRHMPEPDLRYMG